MSLGTLLNLLNGVAEQYNKIFIMTTNHKERLDPALIRKGRIDMEIEFKNADLDQLKQIYERFYKSAWTSELAEQIAYKPESLSPADIIAIAQRYGKDQFAEQVAIATTK